LRRLQDQDQPRLDEENRPKAARLALRKLALLLKLVGIEKGAERIESREHSADGAVEDGAARIHRIHKVGFDDAIDFCEHQPLLGDVVGLSRLLATGKAMRKAARSRKRE
jgi:hypothetical protein